MGPPIPLFTHVQAFCRAVVAPVLFVRADDGLQFIGALVQQRLAWLRDVTVMHVEGGHHVHLEYPERIAAKVLEFLIR